jgi:hypothetical protein
MSGLTDVTTDGQHTRLNMHKRTTMASSGPVVRLVGYTRRAADGRVVQHTCRKCSEKTTSTTRRLLVNVPFVQAGAFVNNLQAKASSTITVQDDNLRVLQERELQHAWLCFCASAVLFCATLILFIVILKRARETRRRRVQKLVGRSKLTSPTSSPIRTSSKRKRPASTSPSSSPEPQPTTLYDVTATAITTTSTYSYSSPTLTPRKKTDVQTSAICESCGKRRPKHKHGCVEQG